MKLCWVLLAAPLSALALPTMIRIGYPNCASCHISPQGGGLLNAYGRGIDEAQSRRAGEYVPTDNSVIRALSWGGRITQDLRTVTQEQVTGGTGQPTLGLFRGRFYYRNVTQLTEKLRVSAIVDGENENLSRPSLAYDHTVRPGQVFLQSAMLQYRARENLEFAAGRDLLPTGVYVSDLSSFVKSRNRLGYYDTPTQVKMFWWGKRYQISPFAFGPSGHERAGEAESGGGTLAEFDVLGKQRTVLGVSLLRASARNGDRRLIGGYARLGFGKWGILAEHDVTDRSVILPKVASFRQQTTYAQLFWAVREWLVISWIGEHLGVAKPFAEDLNAGKFEVVARLTPNFTIGINTRLQKNEMNGRWGPSAALQIAMKTPN